MLATLMLHGVTPGVRLMIDSPDIVYAIFLILFIANFMLIPMGILTSKWFSYMLRMPESLFLPMIVLICMLGAYGSRNSEFDLITALGAGLLGVFFRYLSIPAAPLVIGLVLGSQFEFCPATNLRADTGGYHGAVQPSHRHRTDTCGDPPPLGATAKELTSEKS